MTVPGPYVPRLLDPLIEDLLDEVAALMIVGPRASGKTTTARRHAASVVRLDHEPEAVAFEADPDAALRSFEEPVLLDEWQAVPAVLGAVKRAVDDERRPGRYILTGSVRAELEGPTWPGTGRVVRVPLYGLAVRETRGDPTAPAFLDRLAAAAAAGAGASNERLVGALAVPRDPPDLVGYVELALEGGFPEPLLDLSPPARRRWLESYVDQLLTRDAAGLAPGRDPKRLGRYLEALAATTAGAVPIVTLSNAAGLDRKTAAAYERLLENLLVVETLPAWTSNRLKRLARAEKRHLVDPVLVAPVLRVDARGVLRDGDLLGRVIETFVAAQLRAELAVCESGARLFHLRAEQGRHEIDLVAELGGGAVVAIEVKADAAPRAGSARHLAWLRDHLGERFLAGVVLHTGPRVYALGDRLVAAPIATLWG